MRYPAFQKMQRTYHTDFRYKASTHHHTRATNLGFLPLRHCRKERIRETLQLNLKRPYPSPGCRFLPHSHPQHQVLFGCLWLHERLSVCKSRPPLLDDGNIVLNADHDNVNGAVAIPAAAGGAGHGKVLSKPLSRSLTSIRSLSLELSRLGAVITFAYICEHHPPFPHNKKVRAVVSSLR